MLEISSLKLFRRLQLKFREITWHSNGFVTESSPKVINGHILQDESLLLIPGYFGQKDPIPTVGRTPSGQFCDSWMQNLGARREDWRPSFHIRNGNLAFNFTFDLAAKQSMQKQFEESIVRALYDGPFKGRRFFMRPNFKEVVSGRVDYACCSVPVNFSTDGFGPIPGLCFGNVVAYDWKVFIPDGPERAAIQAALDLDKARGCQEEYHESDPMSGPIRELQEQLDASLQAIAT